ncbi:MAG: PAS domain S-box protein [Gemmatimonadetes bacterium]|nr:PAS domain S-box protein [Gemmatimonadota bacterium]
MNPEDLGRLISAIGVFVQLGGTLLLLVLFALLVQHAGVRPYMLRWMWAWGAVLAAVTIVAIRYFIAPAMLPQGFEIPSPFLLLIHASYQYAKVLYYLMLLQGALELRGQPVLRLRGSGLLWAVGFFSLITSMWSSELSPAMAAQSLVAVPTCLVCSAALRGMPSERRGLGTRLTGAVFLGMAVLWVGYAVSFAAVSRGEQGWQGIFGFLPRYNSYLDLAFSSLLAFGMVTILLEDAKREADLLRASRVRGIAESEGRLKAVIETATDAIVVTDHGGRVVLFNNGAARIFATDRRAAIGQPLSRFLDDAARAEVARKTQDFSHSDHATQALFEVLLARPDGVSIPVEVAASTIRQQEETLQILVLRDASDRRKAEQERTALRERLAHSERMESLGRLVSGVAHELNNPLAAILTFSEELLAEPQEPHNAEALGTIRAQARRARVIVRDLLSFVRRREERREPTDIPALVERTVRAFTGDLAEREVTLGVDIDPGLPLLTCDPAGIEQVLTNLIDNAVRTTTARGEVRVTVRRQENGLALSVEDTGPGIPPHVLSRVFEPFFTTRGTGEGTGLGLSVSLGIVQQHGGTLRAENREPGPGARFTAWLPLGLVASTGVTPPGGLPTMGLKPGGRVLIIDDEASVRSSIRRYFERQQWVVEEAGDGALGLQRLLSTQELPRLDLVICDLRMPNLSGHELHQWLASTRPELLTRLVFASGDTASPETAAFLASSGCPVLEKPFELSELAAVVNRVSRRRPS